MAPNTPYTPDLDGRDPVVAIRDTVAAIARLVASFTPRHFEQPYAPGKWTTRQILIHLAHSELALGTRVRMALTTPNYVAQPFNQDGWLSNEAGVPGPDAASAFVALAAFNADFYETLSDAERQTAVIHPEYGTISVDWVIHQQAGHQVHHLRQLQSLSL
jgi:hypothetical protein